MSEQRGIPPFQTFFQANRALVYRFLVASVGPNEADDCFQETFLAALRAYPELRNADNLRGWVLQIAANKAIDAGRSKGRRPTTVAEVPEGRAAIGGIGPTTPPSADAPATFDPRDPLWTAVRTLPDRMRTAVVLRHMLDRPYDDIASAMGGNEDGARANVHQGLKRLRASLAGGSMEPVGEE